MAISDKREVILRYQQFTKLLSSVYSEIEQMNSSNSQFEGILRDFQAILKKQILGAQGATKKVAENTVWDRLVIAFFGETNAGKSTIIETFRILFDCEERKNQIAIENKSVDGRIVGNGSVDFTKKSHEYHLSVCCQPFTLVDVPGIEGNESEYRSEILNALQKAHIVFYVQGIKRPDSAIVEKIKKYLSDWVSVYSVMNVRGCEDSYDENEERENLLTDIVLKAEQSTKDTFFTCLGNLYKGNITIQALLAICAAASFSPELTKMIKTQETMRSFFGDNKTMYQFSRFAHLAVLVRQQSDPQLYTRAIVESNKEKLVGLITRVENNIRNTAEKHNNSITFVYETLDKYKKNVDDLCENAKSDISLKIYALYNKLFADIETNGYSIIDNKDSSEWEDLITSMSNNLNNVFSENISTAISARINLLLKDIRNATRNLGKELHNIVVSQDNNVNIDIDMSKVVDKMDITFGEICGGLLNAIGGGMLGGSLGGPVGAAIGAAIGAILYGLKMLFTDKKALAKNEFSSQLTTKKPEGRRELSTHISLISSTIDSINDEIKKWTNQEQKSINDLRKKINNTDERLRRAINQLKHIQYGRI